MRSLFKSSSTQHAAEARVPRHSSGWADLLKHLETNESLRVLDVGATSSHNINFLTSLGHSVYMANFVEDAAKPEWRVSVASDEGREPKTRFDIEGFLQANLHFAGRRFDVIALWDTLDYLPVELVVPLVRRLHEVTLPGAKLLAFFHTKAAAGEITFMRYHLTNGSNVEMQKVGQYPILQTFQNRQVETLFKSFGNYRFFLAKDSLQEAIVTR